ncbi:hypothetical protein GCM10022285_57100 [Streptomyces tunisiensis]|uniref:Knr4/Smi1-like domain-containing protein n=1 Tax=Streptomyces tunisiensis TaxID=948699 RepID=A0ABP7Z770_9ACTN
MDLSRIGELLGVPPANGDVNRDWEGVERHYGAALPVDYKQFVSAYGPGCISGQLYVFHPRAVLGDDGLHLESLWEQTALTYGELSRSHPEMYPYPVYPEPGGCIAVARSISGNHVFLKPPSGSVSKWEVVVEMGQWFELNMSFTDFIWQALNGDLFLPVIEGAPSFDPVGSMEM